MENLVNKMNKFLGIGVAMFFLVMVLANTSSASSVNILVSYNSISNTITIVPASNTINANYSEVYNLNFNVIGANSVGANSIISNVIIINSPSNAIIKSIPIPSPVSIGQPSFELDGLNTTESTTNNIRNETIVINQYTVLPPGKLSINLGSYSPSWSNSISIYYSNTSVSAFGTIKQIPKLNIIRDINPSWTSNTDIFNSTVGLNVSVNEIPKLNISQTFIPLWNKTQGFSNSTYGINIIVRAAGKLNITKSFTPSWTANQNYLNTTYGINFSVAQIPKLDLSAVLNPGNSIINETYGINISAEPITSNMLTNNDLITYYNSQTKDCVTYINFTTNGTKYSLCARGAEQSNYSIVDVCTGLSQYTNVSAGLAGCVGTFAALANQSSQSWHSQYLTEFNSLQNATSLLDAYKNGSVIAQQYDQFYINGASVVLVMIIGYILYDARRKSNRQVEKRPPIMKS